MLRIITKTILAIIAIVSTQVLLAENDTIVVNYSYKQGEVILEKATKWHDNQMDTLNVPYARLITKDNINHLYTNCKYLHLQETDIVDGKNTMEYYQKNGKWFNVLKKRGASSDTQKFSLTSNEVKNNPYRVIISNDETIITLVADKKITIIVHPFLEISGTPIKVKLVEKNSGKVADTIIAENDSVDLSKYKLKVTKEDLVTIKNVKINGIPIDFNTDAKDIDLKDIVIKDKKNEAAISIGYSYFNAKGEEKENKYTGKTVIKWMDQPYVGNHKYIMKSKFWLVTIIILILLIVVLVANIVSYDKKLKHEIKQLRKDIEKIPQKVSNQETITVTNNNKTQQNNITYVAQKDFEALGIKVDNLVSDLQKQIDQLKRFVIDEIPKQSQVIGRLLDAQKKDMENTVAEIQRMIQNFNDNATLWSKDKQTILGKIVTQGDRLVDLLSSVEPSAFNNNCEIIIHGAGFFVKRIKTNIESEEWKNKPVSDCLAELRGIGEEMINAGTASWINLLGRLYSYMSVPELASRLEEEGLWFEKVSDIYTTAVALFASFGVIIFNCSPGYDSANNTATNSMFTHNPEIDRITDWLQSEDAVKKAVRNNGRTVYDFGQLAYITADDATIHKGSVMFYAINKKTK